MIISEVGSDATVFWMPLFYRTAAIRELWIEFSMGNFLECIPNDLVASATKTVHCVPLPFFHVIYDYDTTVPVSRKKSKKTGLWYSANYVITELKLAFGKLGTVEYYFKNFVAVL